jgi:hypothetical protein
MNGLLRRLTRRRAATADEHPPGTPAASEPVDATVVSLEEGAPLSEEERELQAREEELRRRRRDIPAGVDPAQLESPTAEGARRGALRRRVRFLRRSREILLRDLGGFYYELHRSGGPQHGGHRDILESKAGRLAAIDHELRELEARLGEPSTGETLVREPGIGGTCPTCGELHGSDAGWCWHCGTTLNERARRRAEHQFERQLAAREAEQSQATASDPATSELVARVREATASGESEDARRETTGGPHDPGARGEPGARNETRDAGTADQPTGKLRAGDEDGDAVTPGERRG